MPGADTALQKPLPRHRLLLSVRIRNRSRAFPLLRLLHLRRSSRPAAVGVYDGAAVAAAPAVFKIATVATTTATVYIIIIIIIIVATIVKAGRRMSERRSHHHLQLADLF